MNSFTLAGKAIGTIDDVEDRITSALKDVGFGILTRVEADKVLKTKLGVDTPPYRILGACNPQIAHKALAAKPEVGVFLPCSVCLQQQDDGTVSIWALDPQAVVDTLGDPELSPHGAEAGRLMEQAIRSVN